MKRINNEIYVSPEVAKLLKEIGFEWECTMAYMAYSIKDNYLYGNIGITRNFNNTNYFVSAPTLDMTQRWLREIKHEFVGVYPVANKWFYSILRLNFGHYYRDKQFKTYEEAQEAGIKKVLEIILKKK